MTYGQNIIFVSFAEFQVDGGDIIEKELLPVKQVRFGDTGSHLDEKEGKYTLGPLLCEGDGNSPLLSLLYPEKGKGLYLLQ